MVYQKITDRIYRKSDISAENRADYLKTYRKNNVKTYTNYAKTHFKKRKAILSQIKLNSGCAICGYKKCARALQFHHLDPQQKKNDICDMRNTLNKALEETKKCIVLCSNCHAELHDKEIKL